MEESSTNVTLHDAATSRAVTNDSIVTRSNHPPPRPAPPPAPRPIVRSQAERAGLSLANQNYNPPSSPYSDMIRHNLQSNHNGGTPFTAKFKFSSKNITQFSVHKSKESLCINNWFFGKPMTGNQTILDCLLPLLSMLELEKM